MRVTKAVCLILCIALLVVCLLWRLDFTWLLASRWSRSETVLFDYPTPTARESPKSDVLLRQARQTVNELWRLNNAHFHIHDQKSPPIRQLNSLLSLATLQLTARLSLLDKLSGRREKRREKVDALSSELRHQISSLQNPHDCGRSRFALADVCCGCGLGCLAHHMALKFSYSFATNRTLLVPKTNDWKDFFTPLSNCSLRHAEGHPDVPRLENTLPKISKGYHAPAMPREWSAKLSGPLGDPFPWYRGHLLDYILRPRDPALRQELEMGLRHLRNDLDGKRHDGPIAGVHIRRTDKLHVEASFHAVEEYMLHVERFFDLKELEYCLETGSTSPPTWSGRRRVFLASDDASVFQEARSRYPRYEFIGQHRNGSAYKIRTSAIGLFSIMLDLHLLVAADFLVCTASSNICRLAYELLSTKSQIHGDAAFQMQSVDKMYECSFSQQRWWTAIADFRQEGVLFGDRVSISSTRWDGFAQTTAISPKNRKAALPAYLFQEIVQTVW
ncbi:Alpha-(1,6)-fucosyltransferase [Sparganum proliferum]